MNKIKSFFNFEIMLLPKLLQSLFIIVLLFCFLAALMVFKKDIILSIVLMIVLPVLARAIFEYIVIQFKQYDALKRISENIKEQQCKK